MEVLLTRIDPSSLKLIGMDDYVIKIFERLPRPQPWDAIIQLVTENDTKVNKFLSGEERYTIDLFLQEFGLQVGGGVTAEEHFHLLVLISAKPDADQNWN